MQLVSVANVSFSCPGLQLNIRDGVRPQDTLLYTLREDTRVTVAVRSSRHVARLELVADTRDLNTSHCYAVMHVSVLIEGEHTATIYSCLNTPRRFDRIDQQTVERDDPQNPCQLPSTINSPQCQELMV